MILLPTMLGPLARMADKHEGTRWAVTGVHFEHDAAGKWCASATDTKRLLRVKGRQREDAAEYPVPAAVAASPNGASSSIIPAAKWEEFFKQAVKTTRRSPREILKSVAVVLGSESATLGATNGDGETPTVQTKPVEGRFPPVNDIMPRRLRTGDCVFGVDARLLAETLDSIRGMSDPAESCIVRFEVFDGYKPIHLSATGAGGVEIDGCIMPVTLGGKDGEYAPVKQLRERVKQLEQQIDAAAAAGQVAVDSRGVPPTDWQEKAARLQQQVYRLKAEVRALRRGETPAAGGESAAPATRAERLASKKAGAA